MTIKLSSTCFEQTSSSSGGYFCTRSTSHACMGGSRHKHDTIGTQNHLLDICGKKDTEEQRILSNFLPKIGNQ
jgi:hypothetical protein